MSSISVPDVMTPCAVTLLRIARKLPAGVNAVRKVRRRAGVVARAASDSSVQTFFAAKKLPELSNRTVQQNCPTPSAERNGQPWNWDNALFVACYS